MTLKNAGLETTNGSPVLLYQVPALTSTVVSSIVVCNNSGASRTFRIQIYIGTSYYLYYDVALPVNDTFVSTIGIVLESGDQINVTGSDWGVTFTLFAQEHS